LGLHQQTVQRCAERAGLKPGDLVKELDEPPVRDAADLQLRLALLRIGEVAEFGVSRPGGTVTVRAAIIPRCRPHSSH
jgi:S1-C subfamily serine protease